MTEPAPAPDDFAGMTVNERLFVAGLLDTFDEAARRRDRAAMIDILKRVALHTPEPTVDAMLENPARYGF